MDREMWGSRLELGGKGHKVSYLPLSFVDPLGDQLPHPGLHRVALVVLEEGEKLRDLFKPQPEPFGPGHEPERLQIILSIVPVSGVGAVRDYHTLLFVETQR
jgi:hypothetical protein